MISHDNRFICNPLDLAYRYQDVRLVSDATHRSVYREAGDPSIVRYRRRYYLFASMSRGFWHSENLAGWVFKPTEKLPALDYAPDVREVNGSLYVSASRRGHVCPFFRSENPLDDDFIEVTPGTFEFWDPNLFQDDDGTVYFYWGCSSTTPLFGTKLDPVTFEAMGHREELVCANVECRGWEQTGENHIQGPRMYSGWDITDLVGHDPFIEGSWMNKFRGTYYLQYAAPGTEYNTYADGYLTSKSPLGPFEYSVNSPFSSKPGGFITGAGHGSTFQDEHGNWWHASTMRVSINHSYERRIGLFPAGFDEDGVLFCNQNFADYPIRVPGGRFDPWTDVSAGWMLLSFRSPITASSSLADHSAELAVNEDVRTWWVAESDAPGEWICADLGREKNVHAIQVNLADHELDQRADLFHDGAARNGFFRAIDPATHTTELLVETSVDGLIWDVAANSCDSDTEQPHAFFPLDEPRSARYVRVTAGKLPFGEPFAVSGLRVFGVAEGDLPGRATVRATRVNACTVRIVWDPVEGAQGYNVRYGIHPKKLYHSWLLYDQTQLELGSLNADVDYWISVDVFNESGITEDPLTIQV